MEKIIFHLIVLVVLIGIMLYSILMQRKGVKRQKTALDNIDESFELSRKSLKNQEKMISLLEQIRDK